MEEEEYIGPDMLRRLKTQSHLSLHMATAEAACERSGERKEEEEEAMSIMQ